MIHPMMEAEIVRIVLTLLSVAFFFIAIMVTGRFLWKLALLPAKFTAGHTVNADPMDVMLVALFWTLFVFIHP